MSSAGEKSLRYLVPAGRHSSALVIDRSRFLCTIERVRSVEEAQQFIREMSANYSDATHNCWAYVVGAPGSTDRIGLSDDGEPHGTAGRPMLTVLAHSGIGEIAAVVTRWYGGIKLGTGGLVKAYSGAVQEALLSLPTVERVETATVAFEAPYNNLGAIQQLLPAVGGEVVEQEFGASVKLRIRLPLDQLHTLESEVQNLMRGAAIFEREE